MMKNYNIAADLLVLANAYYNKGQKKDAVKLFVRAMEEEDSKELIDAIDDENQALDPTPVEEENEVLSEEDIEEILNEGAEEEPEEEIIEEEIEIEEPAEEAPAEEAEELPEMEDAVAKVLSKKATIANLQSLSGKSLARQAAMRRFLKK